VSILQLGIVIFIFSFPVTLIFDLLTLSLLY